MVVNSHLSIHDRFYSFSNCSRTSTTPSIVPAFLRSTSCGMTSARGHGAIVYCLNSGSEYRQMGRHNGEKKSRERTDGRRRRVERRRDERRRQGRRRKKRAESGIGVERR
ncbi:hypothetical protein TNCV_4182291 [Trichonephila clavipes]|nr:hypothetical protein TNCV_4182291 [Trichonephila clavipes]